LLTSADPEAREARTDTSSVTVCGAHAVNHRMDDSAASQHTRRYDALDRELAHR
jgi:hypothetical protein